MANVEEEKVQVTDNGDHYLVKRGAGTFKVAKRGAGALGARLQRQSMASGGEVGAEDDLSPADMAAVEPWKPMISAVAQRTGEDPYLLTALMLRESAGDPTAMGDNGDSRGLFQINSKYHPGVSDDPTEQAGAAAGILKTSEQMFPGNRQGAVAAYNAGPSAVKRLLDQGRNPDLATTGQDYGSWVLRRAEALRKRGLYEGAADTGTGSGPPGAGNAPSAAQAQPAGPSGGASPMVNGMMSSHRSRVQATLMAAHQSLQGPAQQPAMPPNMQAVNGAGSGGMPPPMPSVSQDQGAPQAAQTQPQAAQGASTQGQDPGLQAMLNQPPMEAAHTPFAGPAQQGGVAYPSAAKPQDQKALAQQQAQAAQPEQQQAQPAPVDQVAQGVANAFGPQAQGEADQAFTQSYAGLQGQALAQQHLAVAQQAAGDYAQKRMAELAQQRQQSFTQWQQRGDDLYQKLMGPEGQVNPDRFWATRSTPQKVSAIIGMMLGGFNQGARGGVNPATQLVNAAIDRDIDAQKTNIGRLSTAFSWHMQQGAAERDAQNLARADLMDQVAGQFQQAAAKFQGESSAAGLQQAGGQLRLQALQTRQQIASNGLDMDNKLVQREMSQYQIAFARAQWIATQRMMGGGGEQGQGGGVQGVPPQMSTFLSPDMQKKLVRDPSGSGNMVLAKDEESKKAYDTAAIHLNTLRGVYHDMRAYSQDEAGHWLKKGIPLIPTKAKEDADRLQAQYVATLSKLQDVGVKGPALSLLQKQTPQLSRWMEGAANDQIDSVGRYIDQLDSDLSNQFLALPQRKSFTATPRGR
jgi:hypothetical protein